MRPLVQDFWCSPPYGVTTLGLDAPDGIQVLRDSGEAEIGDPRMTGIIHKDVRLVGRQRAGETRFRTATYSLEVPVNDITGMEVAEALGDVR